MDVADDYPAAQVMGIDLSPIQPSLIPPNLQFQIMVSFVGFTTERDVWLLY